MTLEPTIDMRLRQCWRRLMRAWVKRWQVVHRDARENANANYCLQRAIGCRDKSASVNRSS